MKTSSRDQEYRDQDRLERSLQRTEITTGQRDRVSLKRSRQVRKIFNRVSEMQTAYGDKLKEIQASEIDQDRDSLFVLKIESGCKKANFDSLRNEKSLR